MDAETFEITDAFVDVEGVERTSHFQREELQAQVDLLCRHLQGGSRIHLLPYLVWLRIRPKGWNLEASDNADAGFRTWVKKHRLPTKIAA